MELYKTHHPKLTFSMFNRNTTKSAKDINGQFKNIPNL